MLPKPTTTRHFYPVDIPLYYRPLNKEFYFINITATNDVVIFSTREPSYKLEFKTRSKYMTDDETKMDILLLKKHAIQRLNEVMERWY